MALVVGVVRDPGHGVSVRARGPPRTSRPQGPAAAPAGRAARGARRAARRSRRRRRGARRRGRGGPRAPSAAGPSRWRTTQSGRTASSGQPRASTTAVSTGARRSPRYSRSGGVGSATSTPRARRIRPASAASTSVGRVRQREHRPRTQQVVPVDVGRLVAAGQLGDRGGRVRPDRVGRRRRPPLQRLVDVEAPLGRDQRAQVVVVGQRRVDPGAGAVVGVDLVGERARVEHHRHRHDGCAGREPFGELAGPAARARGTRRGPAGSPARPASAAPPAAGRAPRASRGRPAAPPAPRSRTPPAPVSSGRPAGRPGSCPTPARRVRARACPSAHRSTTPPEPGGRGRMGRCPRETRSGWPASS